MKYVVISARILKTTNCWMNRSIRETGQKKQAFIQEAINSKVQEFLLKTNKEKKNETETKN